MNIDTLTEFVVRALDDHKARDLRVIDVRGKTAITDFMVIASGTSDRHVKALANSVVTEAAAAGVKPLGMEGERDCEWVLVDLCDVVVHIMLPSAREFYGLEKFWSVDSGAPEKHILP
jgi:ribosome-associated protein